MHIHHSQRELLRQCLQEAVDRQLPACVIMRLQWIEDVAVHGSVSGTCRRFGIARTTLYRWLNRFDPQNLLNLQDEPKHRPCNNDVVMQATVASSMMETGNVHELLRHSSVLAVVALRMFWGRWKAALLTMSVLINLILFLGMLAIAHWEASRADLLGHTTHSQTSHAAFPEISP